MRAAGGGVSDGHVFTGVRDQRKLCPFVLSTVEKPLRGSKAGAQNQLSKSFWEKNKSTIPSLGHQLVRNPDVKFLCVSSSFCAGLISSVTGNIAKIGRWGAGSWVGALGSGGPEKVKLAQGASRWRIWAGKWGHQGAKTDASPGRG